MDEDTLADPIGKWMRLGALLHFGWFQAVNFRAHLVEGGAQILQYTGSDTIALHHQAEQYMLGADKVVPHAPGFFEGKLDHLLDPRGRDDLLNSDSLIATQNRLDDLANSVNVNAQVSQHVSGQPIVLPQQTKKEMLGADIAVAGTLGFFLGEREHPLGAFGEPLEWVDGSPPTQD